MPCHPARARKLLKAGRAAVFRRIPFTIILLDRKDGNTQEADLRIDPGSRCTGLALVGRFQSEDKVLWAAELNHRGLGIQSALVKRRALRRGRRYRKVRHRAARFDNRRRPEGWLPPSLGARVDNVVQWAKRLRRRVPISTIQLETVRFDTQALQDPEISGVEYQRGTLFGFEAREYLLFKWNHRCAYCNSENVPLEIDHVVPRSKGGSNRVSNLVMACRSCNQAKGNQTLEEFLKGKPNILKRIQSQLKAPLRDAAAVNATRYAIGRELSESGFAVSCWSGGRTKWNRVSLGHPKEHWIDAACVGDRGHEVKLDPSMPVLEITAKGRGRRQVQQTDRYGFPRAKAKRVKRVFGFQTGDLVELRQSKGKYAGRYVGHLAGVRERGDLDIRTPRGKVGANSKRFRLLQRFDGYEYGIRMPKAAGNRITHQAA
jgi:5-methylcytosine-specific restriction endonuclease McrA